MQNYCKLSYRQLKKYCDLTNFKFDTTDEIPCLVGIMGQERAEEAMEFGLGIDHPSYNIYISGAKGTGRTSYAKKVVEKKSQSQKVPVDWCYVYNFDSKGKIEALSLPAGMGRIFKKDMDELIEELLIQVPRAFNSVDYEKQRNEIIKEYQEQKNKLIQYLSSYSKEKHFVLKSTTTGFVFTPIYEENEISEDKFDELDEEVKEQLEKQLEEIHEAALDILSQVKKLERVAKKKLLQLEMKVGIYVIKPLINELFKKYNQCENVHNYLKKVESDIIENIFYFYSEEVDEDDEIITIKTAENEDIIKKYKVNLFVDNSNTEGAPVIMEFNPTLNNLVGKIEYENVNGSLRTDFLLVKPGAIQIANGGYLIIQARQLLSNPYAWETLKRILQTKEVTVESMGSQLGIGEVSSMKLEPIPINLKVILIGSSYLYHLLYRYDEDFEKYFKILVDFNDDMKRNDENEQKMISFISCYTQNEGLLSFDKKAVAELMEYSSRLIGSQTKFSTRFNKIIEIIIEANQWAQLEKSVVVSGTHVKHAVDKKWERLNQYEENVLEMFEQGKILIDVKGNKIGVVNGLSVISIGEYMFGKPSVITVTTSKGKGNIINIEREVNLSGDIYDKGIMILTGFLLEKFAQDDTFNLSVRICFEQSYGGVDGDSASSAELYGLLSSIAKLPLKQNIAVTGSVNQKGFIQPVGGVTEKIEGFFKLCYRKGLTGDQGVIIPHQNIGDLMLRDEVVEAVKAGKFHIYAVKHVDEGIEILTDRPAEEVYKIVEERLKTAVDNKNNK
ncbi:AAA family ATPase [Alkaliphilus sp. MSJ-5]|uniref:endopeptidase La n=1 Tax=Alkaliphilus flagellatus TaxID=2841507 RepID=A0ABS6G1X7_9FIRM|nr:ATP-binding protein [Alkaliphilus flagellatus]MBU5675376.1 AAA family ATPase [Alkaliphilus flagellatus]